jgi:hypothetical protein
MAGPLGIRQVKPIEEILKETNVLDIVAPNQTVFSVLSNFTIQETIELLSKNKVSDIVDDMGHMCTKPKSGKLRNGRGFAKM